MKLFFCNSKIIGKMKKWFLLLGVIVFCSTIVNAQYRLERSAGNLKAELEFLYDFFEINKNRDPYEAAQIWCEVSRSSWKEAGNNSPGAWCAVVSPRVSDRYNYVIARLTMIKKLYSATIIRVKHKDVCQILRSIFGSPSSSTTRNGEEFSVWNTEKGFRITVEYNSARGTVVDFELPD